jgi:hypothetical protein
LCGYEQSISWHIDPGQAPCTSRKLQREIVE